MKRSKRGHTKNSLCEGVCVCLWVCAHECAYVCAYERAYVCELLVLLRKKRANVDLPLSIIILILIKQGGIKIITLLEDHPCNSRTENSL